MMKAGRLLILGALFLPLSALAESPGHPNQVFKEANQAVEAGRWDEALQSYESLIAQGFGGAPLYYNLANVHFRRGERGRAILWYERARRLAPRDPDVTFNLDLSRSHLKDARENPFQRVALFFTTTELGWTFTVLSFLFFGLLGARSLGWVRPEPGTRAGIWFSGTALLLAGSWFAANIVLSERPIAIVVSPPGEVRNGPGPEYAVGFTIPEGSKVIVLQQRPSWTQVGVPEQGLKGWMPSVDVEPVAGKTVSVGEPT